jgi:hypothetical protein
MQDADTDQKERVLSVWDDIGHFFNKLTLDYMKACSSGNCPLDAGDDDRRLASSEINESSDAGRSLSWTGFAKVIIGALDKDVSRQLSSSGNVQENKDLHI